MNKYNNWLAKLLAIITGNDHYAITIGQTVRWSHGENFVWLRPWWRAHEQRHREQWAREGWRMAYRYLWQSLTRGYDKNCYEIDANEVANKMYPEGNQ